ncbi:MAG: serine hydrolase, partial [Gemmatimonadota bacterium]|nr:serine hydrolase [Gemmatimonadota bacterium]
MPNYCPDSHDWQRRSPVQAGFDADKLAAALAFAQTQEIQASTNLADMLPKGDRHPNDRPLGPLKKRGSTAGLIVRQGYLVATFGPVDSVEVTFSCAKSYISAVAGVAFDQGLIRDLDEPVGRTVADGGFDAPQNQSITWRHLLQQTSEWEGELFGIPDWIDRGRGLGQGAVEATVGGTASSADNYRSLEPPGTFWEYN